MAERSEELPEIGSKTVVRIAVDCESRMNLRRKLAGFDPDLRLLCLRPALQ